MDSGKKEKYLFYKKNNKNTQKIQIYLHIPKICSTFAAKKL